MEMKKLAGELAFKLGRRKRDKPLSNCWLYGFLGRWRERLSTLKPSALDSNRAKNTTPEAVQTYFHNLKNTIDTLHLENRPDLIFNMDETGISPEHRPPNIIAPSNEKPHSVTSPRSATTTLIACANAAGSNIPPYFVFKGKRFNEDLMQGASAGAGYAMSDSGWSTTTVFQDYLKIHFLKHVKRDHENQPVLLILDGHTTHTSSELIQWALTNNIHIFVLPAHTSHVLQPLDVAVFGPFKRFYYSECSAYMKTNMGKIVTKYDIAAIACQAYLKAMSPWNIVSAFKKTGIYPLDKTAISQNQLYPCEAFRDETPLQKINALCSGKEAIDAYLQKKADAEKNKTTVQTNKKCNCMNKRKKLSKPNPGGKEITSEQYIEEVDLYSSQKVDVTPAFPQLTKSPQPSTSGLNVIHVNDIHINDSDNSTDSEGESEVCCVCGLFYPRRADENSFIKIVNWAQCDECGHWVHLAFCDKKRVLRRGDAFRCMHCII
ncbi:hypothetical protein DPMN_068417 [Dreissena polymorpha]|uniref:DDE-1 domain-containing protein n=3 Tax=Dreissena polymorpha TaxID=45954 RepID=A0A9D3YXL3_DREPO|nr:hypothetical protein DPMN_068417 [Dreissena polymorpha]